MELKQLEAFGSVAESGSFSAAAGRLFLTQPTVSAHVASLEKELGIRLFERTTKALNLSADGRRLLNYATRMIELKKIILEYSADAEDKTIRIGASTIPSSYLLPEITESFMLDNPGCSVVVKHGNSREVEEMVCDGAVFFGVVGRANDRQELVSERLCPDELVIAMPAKAEFKKIIASSKPREKKIGMLLKHPLVLREEGSGTKSAAESLLAGYETGMIVMRSNDQEAIKHMVASGVGISIMSQFAARDMVKAGQLLVFPVGEEAPRSFYIISKKGAAVPGICERYVETARKHYARYMER